MDEWRPYLEALQSLAKKLSSYKLRKSATLKFHILAGALFWSDEVPLWLSAEQDDAMRCLLRYRTSLILGEPEENLKRFWDVGMQHFPDWIGFSKERVTPSPELIAFYRRHEAQVDRCSKRIMDDLDNS
jgi:hypothetical protein